MDDPGGNKMLLVMDYMEGGPVLTREGLERGRRIPEPLALQYFRDMCKVGSALFLHLPLVLPLDAIADPYSPETFLTASDNLREVSWNALPPLIGCAQSHTTSGLQRCSFICWCRA